MIKKNIDIPYRSIDEFLIRDNAYLLQDCQFDNSGAIRKRFGTSLYFDLTTISSNYAGKRVDGYWFQERQTYIACCNGDIFEFSTLSGTYTKIGTGLLNADRRVTFDKCFDSDNSNKITLLMSNGGDPVYYDGTTCDLMKNNANYAGNIPTTVTHIVAQDQFVFVNDTNNPNTAKYCDATKPFKWNPVAGNPYDIPAQAVTDDINGVYRNGGLVWIQGKDSIEPIQNTAGVDNSFVGVSPFIRVPRGLIEIGTVNPYAIGVVNKIPYLLNTQRDIMTLNGFTPQSISESYDERIQGLSSTLDVEVDVQSGIGGKTFVIFNFQDASTSIVYDYSFFRATGKHAFYEWGSWNESKQSYDQYPYITHAYCTSWNYHLVGGRDGKIYRLRTDKYTDNGDSIRSEIITGIYGNPMLETKSSEVFFHFRRGDGLDSSKYTKSYSIVRYRKNLNEAWVQETRVDNGAIGDTKLSGNNKIDIGAYYTIQYRILHTDDAPFVMYGIYENKKNEGV